MLLCNADALRRAVLARSTDHVCIISCQVRFATHHAAVGYQVTAHLPPKVLALLSDAQRAALAAPLAGAPAAQRLAAKDNAALECVAALVRAGALDAAYKAVPPALVQVRCRPAMCVTQIRNGRPVETSRNKSSREQETIEGTRAAVPQTFAV